MTATRLFLIIPLSLCLLAACAGGDKKQGDGHRMRPGSAHGYMDALYQKEQGNCVEAIPTFKRMAAWGRGFEVAQFQLGDCYLQIAQDKQDPERAEFETKGFTWVEKAAQSNQADAQASLANLYLVGTGADKDLIEAGKWLVIFDRNAAVSFTSSAEMNASIRVQIEAALSSAEWVEAKANARVWMPTFQEDTTPKRKFRRIDNETGGPHHGGQRQRRVS